MAQCDHVDRFARLSAISVPTKYCAFATMNSGMEIKHFYQGTKAESIITGAYGMSNKFYGIDIHKNYATISVLNDKGEEIEFINKCSGLEGYIRKIGEGDHAAIEAYTGSFHWAGKIEGRGATCDIINPYKFKIQRIMD